MPSYSPRLNDAKNTRSTAEGANNISVRTSCENKCKPIFQAYIEDVYPGYTIEIIDNGCDNSGNLILDDNKADNSEDWLLVRKSSISQKTVSFPLEVMVHSGTSRIATIKDHKLEKCANDADSFIILVRETYFHIINSKQAKNWLELLDKKKYDAIGGKEGRRISFRDFNNPIFVEKYYYTKRSMDIMNSLKSEIFVKTFGNNYYE